MVGFIDDHREVYGVESICTVVPIALDVFSAQASPGGSHAAITTGPSR
jgi:hypothetical protein